MISSFFRLRYEGKIFDKIASADVDLEDTRAVIQFFAPYAQYAFNSPIAGVPFGGGIDFRGRMHYSNRRDILNSAFERYESKMIADFQMKYLQTFSVKQAAGYAVRQVLKAMRQYELKAPGPRPPARNRYPDRLRRITGRLSDTASIALIKQPPGVRRFEAEQRLTPGRKAKLARRVTRTDRPSRIRIRRSFS